MYFRQFVLKTPDSDISRLTAACLAIEYLCNGKIKLTCSVYFSHRWLKLVTIFWVLFSQVSATKKFLEAKCID